MMNVDDIARELMHSVLPAALACGEAAGSARREYLQQLVETGEATRETVEAVPRGLEPAHRFEEPAALGW